MGPRKLLAAIADRPQIAFWLAGLAFVAVLAFIPPRRTGDGHEYLATLEAWRSHATPDVRPADIARLPAEFLLGLGPSLDVQPSHHGPGFTPHFWLYPLFAVPARLLLELMRGNRMAALQVTNAAMFVLALYVVLFRSSDPPARRWALAGLAGISPVLGYVGWTHPEVFTWSLVLISLVHFGNRSYPWAAVWASLAAMQNPPVAFLAGYAVLVCAAGRDWSRTMRAAAGAALSFVPMGFTLYFYGVPNLIARSGATDPSLVSLGRTASFFLDLNQGLLGYVPLLLALSLVALYRALRTRDVVALGMTATLMLLVLPSESTTNWNSGAAGLMRYAVWVIPLLAWLAARLVPVSGRALRVTGVAVVLQAVVLIGFASPPDYVSHGLAARAALRWAPALYNPEPEIFVERQFHREEIAPSLRSRTPYIMGDGRVTKLLVDAATLERLPQDFLVEAPYLARLKARFGGRKGLFYVHPPPGAVRAFGKADLRFLQVAFVGEASSPLPDRVSVPVRVANAGSVPAPAAGLPAVTPVIGYRVYRGSILVSEGSRPLPASVPAGGTITMPLDFEAPARAGEHEIEVFPLLGPPSGVEPQVRRKFNFGSRPVIPALGATPTAGTNGR